MKRRQRGFTLVEAMVGVAIFTVLTLAMAGTFLVGYRAISNEARVIAADTAFSNASLWVTRDFNSANSLPAGTISTSTSLTFSYGSPAVNVTYSIDSSRNLMRTVATAQVVARGITSVAVSWAGCYGTVTIQPSATGASAVVLNVSNRPGGCI
jgi:prepilin-type N-terminal cleavage/methylation domain-containing protein